MRYFAPVTAEQLYAKVMEKFTTEGQTAPTWEALHGTDDDADRVTTIPIAIDELVESLRSDLKVQFDLENWDYRDTSARERWQQLGLHTFPNGLTYWGFLAGGDWEHPVYWIVYWDGKKLRAYVPTHGNPWNRKTKKAYGNDEKADLADLKKIEPNLPDGVDPTECVDFNWDHVVYDILHHILPKP